MAKSAKTRIEFVGNNATNVTGSCILITLPNKKQILLECGLFQENLSLLELYRINNKRFSFKPKNLAYIFGCHNHIDHIGLIPRLYKEGCNCPFIMPVGSAGIAKILLEDCAYLAQKDADLLSKQKGKDYSPTYTAEDNDNTLSHLVEFPPNQEIVLDDNISFMFVPSGHILNSCQLLLKITVGTQVSRILYTSDLGNISINNEYITPLQKIRKCNVLIGESTYSNPSSKHYTNKDRIKDIEKIKSVIQDCCIEANATVLFPVFANQRCQNILSLLYDIYHEDVNFRVPIYIDSPMAQKICKEFSAGLRGEQLEKWRQVMSWKNVHFIDTYEDSKNIRLQKSPKIVLASSGMCVGGRVLGWLQDLLPNVHNHIISVGYSVEGSLLWKIKQRTYKHLRIDGKTVANRANITVLNSFSSHLQCQDLAKYYSEVDCEEVALVHGDMKQKIIFGKFLADKISERDKTTKVVVVNKDTSILI